MFFLIKGNNSEALSILKATIENLMIQKDYPYRKITESNHLYSLGSKNTFFP